MSFFLQDVAKLTPKIPNIDISRERSIQGTSISQESFQRFEQCMNKQIRKHKEFTNILITSLGQSKIYGFLFTNISSQFHGLLCFNYKQNLHSVSVVFYLLDQSFNYFKFQSKQMLTEFYRMVFLKPETESLNLKLVLNHQNGRVSLQLNYFALSGSNLVEDMNKSFLFQNKNIILEIYRIFFSPIIQHLEKAIKPLISIQSRKDEQPEDKMLSSLRRYAKMMTTKAFLNSQTMMHQQTRVNQLNMRQKNCLKLFENQLPIDKPMTKSFSFYGVWNNPIPQKKYLKHQFFISEPEEKSIISAIALEGASPTQTQPQRGHSNLLNFIKIKDVSNLKTHPLNFGGFSNLESAVVQFWFLDSFSKENEEMNPRSLQQRYMALKKENRPHGKNFHEYRILSEMRNTTSSFFPKYYIPTNFPNSDYSVNPIIMMDLLNDGNLVQYLKFKYHYMSLLSKVYIMFSIAMTLRFLQTYKIVHLDLKPNNIMLAPGLLTKLIDFGQAYHPEVCKTANYRYRPGVTLPYSPPEFLHGLKYGFTSKSDVYSLGILMFQIIYGKVPFQNRQFLFQAAQNNDIYGNPMIIRILNCMITRCFSRNPDMRPQLDWIALILRLCLEIIV